jgi:hypothetical protein
MKCIVPLLAALLPCWTTAADISTTELLSELPPCAVRLSPLDHRRNHANLPVEILPCRCDIQIGLWIRRHQVRMRPREGLVDSINVRVQGLFSQRISRYNIHLLDNELNAD